MDFLNTLTLEQIKQFSPDIVKIYQEQKISKIRNVLKSFENNIKYYDFQSLLTFTEIVGGHIVYKDNKQQQKQIFSSDIKLTITLGDKKLSLENIIIESPDVTFVVDNLPLDKDIHYYVLDNSKSDNTILVMKSDHKVDEEFLKIFGDDMIYLPITYAKYTNIVKFNRELYDKWISEKDYFEKMFVYYNNKQLS